MAQKNNAIRILKFCSEYLMINVLLVAKATEQPKGFNH